MQAEIDEFHRKIRARALLIAIQWAGSADALARMAGLSRDAGQKWTQRGEITPLSALSLSRINGFPLTFQEMQPGFDLRTLTGVRCPRCGQRHGRPGRPTEYPSILIARSEASARKLAADPSAVERYRKRKAQRASRRTLPKP